MHRRSNAAGPFATGCYNSELPSRWSPSPWGGPSRRAGHTVRRPRTGRQDAHAGADPPAAERPDRHPWRPHAQPEEHRPDAPAAAAHRRDRGERLGEVVPCLRHGLRRGAAPLRRVAVGVRAPVPRADGEAERRPHRRHLPGHSHSPEEQPAEPAVDGRDDNRDLRLSPAPLRPRRADHLPRLRCRSGPRDGGGGGTGAEWTARGHPAADRLRVPARHGPGLLERRRFGERRRGSGGRRGRGARGRRGKRRSRSRGCRRHRRASPQGVRAPVRRGPGRVVRRRRCVRAGRQPVAARRGRPHPDRGGRARPAHRVHRGGLPGRGRIRVRRGDRRRRAGAARVQRALRMPAVRHPLRGPPADAVLLQQPVRRLSDVPRLRQRDRA